MSDTTRIRYVGPSAQPIVIADTGQVAVRADAPESSRLPDDDGNTPAEEVDVPTDLADRLCRQNSWERVEDPDPDQDSGEGDLPGLYEQDSGPLSDTPAPAGEPTYDQEV